MAMSRIVSQSILPLRSPAAIISHHRHRFNKSHLAQLIEVDLEAASSSPEEVITMGKRLEDAIHGMIVRRAAPDWLPFLPGYSYWVPPRRSSVIRRLPSTEAMFDFVGKLSGKPEDLLSDDEHMSCASSKGWPSSSYFIDGTSSMHTVPVMEVEVKIQDNDGNADNSSNCEDGEG